MAEQERSNPTPSAEHLVAFNRAALSLTGITEDDQWKAFGQAANQLKKDGLSDAGIFEQLWSARPDLRPASTTPEEAVARLSAIQAEERAQRERVRNLQLPFGNTMKALEFHTSIIQQAALTEQTIVVRDRNPDIDDLPPDIPPADPRKSYYMNPLELNRPRR